MSEVKSNTQEKQEASEVSPQAKAAAIDEQVPNNSANVAVAIDDAESKPVAEGEKSPKKAAAERKTPVKRTPSKRTSFIERAQKESEELVRNMGGNLELEGGRRTRSSTGRTPSRAAAVTPPVPAKRARQSTATSTTSPKGRTPARGRGRGRQIDVAAEEIEESTKNKEDDEPEQEEEGKKKVSSSTADADKADTDTDKTNEVVESPSAEDKTKKLAPVEEVEKEKKLEGKNAAASSVDGTDEADAGKDVPAASSTEKAAEPESKPELSKESSASSSKVESVPESAPVVQKAVPLAALESEPTETKIVTSSTSTSVAPVADQHEPKATESSEPMETDEAEADKVAEPPSIEPMDVDSTSPKSNDVVALDSPDVTNAADSAAANSISISEADAADSGSDPIPAVSEPVAAPAPPPTSEVATKVSNENNGPQAVPSNNVASANDLKSSVESSGDVSPKKTANDNCESKIVSPSLKTTVDGNVPASPFSNKTDSILL